MSGIISGSVGDHFGITLGSLWDQFGYPHAAGIWGNPLSKLPMSHMLIGSTVALSPSLVVGCYGAGARP